MKNLMPYCFGLFAVISVILANPYGPKISPDGAHYIRMAIQALETGFLDIPTATWPPGFPWVLATISLLFSIDLFQSVVLVNAISTGVIAFFLTKLIGDHSHEDDKISRALTGSLATLLLLYVVIKSSVALRAMSDLFFSSLFFCGTYFLHYWTKNKNNLGNLGIASLFLFSSYYVRYIGVVGIMLWTIFLILSLNKLSLKHYLNSRIFLFSFTLSVIMTTFFIIYYKTRFGFWITPEHSVELSNLFINTHDYYISFFKNLNLPKGDAFDVGFSHDEESIFNTSASAIVKTTLFWLILIFPLVYSLLKKKSIKLKVLTTYTVVTFVYSISLIILHSIYSISGLFRFTIPAVIIFLPILFLSNYFSAISRRAYRVCIYTLLLLTLHSLGEIIHLRMKVYPALTLRDYNVRGTKKFKDLEALILSSKKIYWIPSKYETSYFEASVFSSHFYCKPFKLFESHKEDILVHEDIVLASDGSLPYLVGLFKKYIEFDSLELKQATVIRLKKGYHLTTNDFEPFQIHFSGIKIHNAGCKN